MATATPNSTSAMAGYPNSRASVSTLINSAEARISEAMISPVEIRFATFCTFSISRDSSSPTSLNSYGEPRIVDRVRGDD